MLKLVKHDGVVLEPSKLGLDRGSSTFGCMYKDVESGKFYLFYSGAENVDWSKSAIFLAVSDDGFNFKKLEDPLFSSDDPCITTAVFRLGNRFWMVYAVAHTSKNPLACQRELAIAVADDLTGPWKFVKKLIKPERIWEGNGIDIGPGVVHIGNDEVLIYYSNIWNHFISRLSRRYWHRQIGALSIKIKNIDDIQAKKVSGNPLHLNGDKGSWNESVFCPGYFTANDKHYLLTSASTYSIDFPYKQYIGLVEDVSPLFKSSISNNMLINGPEEKASIIKGCKSEIALDCPSPIIIGDELWIYYSAMDRHDSLWKIALSRYKLN